MQTTYKNKEIPDLDNKKCAVIFTLEKVSGKWKLPIIWKLSKKEGTRYNELKRELEGITNIMLTRALNALIEDGIVKRIDFEEIPPHTEYYLTESGKKLLPAMEVFKEWGLEQMELLKKD